MFKKAEKSQSKLRCAIFGASGSGKTYSALAIGSGMGKRIALIDTEFGSASKYASTFNFDICDLENKDIESYIKSITFAAQAKYDILIIDSLTHAWHQLLEDVEKLAQAKYHGNTWSAWSQGTPRQKRLINAIITFPGHVIGTMRCKTDWILEKNEKTGKSMPVRVGLTPEQGKGIEYEFDLLLNISPTHTAEVLKDRTGKFQDKLIEKPGKEFGKELITWLNEGKSIPKIKASKKKEWEEQISKTNTLEVLKNVYTEAIQECLEIKDKETEMHLMAIKDIRKQELLENQNQENQDV